MRVRKITRLLTSVVLLGAAVPAQAQWVPPIGIPTPGFGITQAHTMYVGRMYPYSTGSAAYNDGGNGPYTHFVDALSPSCTNSGNEYGTVATPRCAMPSPSFVAPGAVIEVRATPPNKQISMIYIGTAAAPIFIRGASAARKGVVRDVSFLVRGQYVIHEHLEFIGQGPDIRSVAETVHHIAVRNSYLHSGASTGARGVSEQYVVSHVVVYNNQIHTDSFDPNGGEYAEDDQAGVHVGRNSEDVWVVDNDIRGASGDAVGAGNAANYTARRWYIGRNLLHDTGENGVDLKEVDGVVVSQNKIYNFKGLSSGSDGTAVVIHYGPRLSARNTWFIFNEIYNASDKGIQVGGAQVHESYFIGNIVRNIRNANGTARAFVTWGSCKINVVGNTFVNNDNGIDATGTAGCGQLIFKNNIVANLQAPSGYSIGAMTDSGYRAAAESSHNLVYPAAVGPCASCVNGMPAFVDPARGDFRLQAGSPGLDDGDSTVMSQLAATFKTLFGMDIYRDADGKNRRIGVAEDIGAFEFGGAVSIRPPSNLRMVVGP